MRKFVKTILLNTHKGMNILIIGATSGIGHELWKYYASEKNKVAVLGRRKAEIDSMIKNSTGY